MVQSRALLLAQSRRYSDAVELLREDLARNPTDVSTHYLLAICYAELDELYKATEHARAAIANGPGSPAGHYALARAMVARKRFAEADAAIDEAIRLDANTADNFAAKAQIRFMMSDWQGTLAAANAGLRLDPQDKDCANLRGMALRQLKQGQMAESEIRHILSRDPENSTTHANLGWSLLEQHRPQDALHHFQEALRLEPDSEFARQGLINALRSRYVIYRWLFSYFAWLSKLGPRYTWLILIGGYVGFRTLVKIAIMAPPLAPFIWPIAIAYTMFALSTWLVVPLTNLLLLTNRHGRFALSGEEKVFSAAVGGCLIVALVGVAIYFAGRGALPVQWIQLSVMIGAFSLPLAGTLNCDRGWPRNVAYGILGVLGLHILLVLVIALTQTADGADSARSRTSTIFGNYLVLCLLSQFAVMGLASAKPRR